MEVYFASSVPFVYFVEHLLIITMETFKVEEFCESYFRHKEQRKLRKEDLVAVAWYFEVDDIKKLVLVETLITE